MSERRDGGAGGAAMVAALLAALAASSCGGPAPSGEAGAPTPTPPGAVRITEPTQAARLASAAVSRIRGTNAERVARVEVALAWLQGERCRWLREFDGVTIEGKLPKNLPARAFGPVQDFGRPTKCTEPAWHRARLRGESWTFRIECGVAPGNYRVLARAIGEEEPASDAVVFRVV